MFFIVTNILDLQQASMARLIVPFALLYVAVLGVSSTNYFRKFVPHYRSYFASPYRQQYWYAPYKTQQPKKIVPALKSSPLLCKRKTLLFLVDLQGILPHIFNKFSP